jgi:hypothetical protein
MKESGMNKNAIFAMLENIVTLICACLCAYFISPWCFFLLLNLNSVKTVTEITKNEVQ